MRALVFLIICVAAAVVGYSVAGTHRARGRSAEAEAFLRQIADGHAGAAYDSATESFKTRFPWEDFQGFVNNFRLGQYRPDSLQAESARADVERSTWREGFSSVELDGEGALSDDTRFHCAMKLRRERGLWRVDSLYVTVPRQRSKTPPAGTNDAPQTEHPARESGVSNPPVGPSPAGNTQPAHALPPSDPAAALTPSP